MAMAATLHRVRQSRAKGYHVARRSCKIHCDHNASAHCSRLGTAGRRARLASPTSSYDMATIAEIRMGIADDSVGYCR